MRVLINFGWSFLIMFTYGFLRLGIDRLNQNVKESSLVIMFETLGTMPFIFFVAFIMLMIFNKKKKIENNLDTDKDFK